MLLECTTCSNDSIVDVTFGAGVAGSSHPALPLEGLLQYLPLPAILECRKPS